MAAEFAYNHGESAPESREALDALALIINMRASFQLAKNIQAQRARLLADHGQRTSKRFILKEPVLPTVPIWTDRITLGHDAWDPEWGVEKLIARFPAEEAQTAALLDYPNDVFLELREDYGVKRHLLLNSFGLHEYHQREDLMPNPDRQQTNDLYLVVGALSGETSDMRLVKHLMTEFSPQEQIARLDS